MAGSAADMKETIKTSKYTELAKNYFFVPLGLETYGSWGTEGIKLIKDIGKKVSEVSGEKHSTSFISQNISMSLQRGNANCVLGTVPHSESLDEIYQFVSTQSWQVLVFNMFVTRTGLHWDFNPSQK